MSEPSAEILVIGSELVAGGSADLNGPFLAHQAESLGFVVRSRSFVSDDRELLAEKIRAALGRGTRLLLLSGGLGPTPDDVTRDAIALALDRRLVLDSDALERLDRRAADRGRALGEGARRQALLPEGAATLANSLGSAQGLFIEPKSGTWLVALPGVPRELETMVTRELLPRLRGVQPGNATAERVLLRIGGIGETEVSDRVAKRVGQSPVRPSFLARPGEVEVAIAASRRFLQADDTQLEGLLGELREEFGAYAFHAVAPQSGEVERDAAAGGFRTALVRAVAELLVDQQAKLACAESCTGGLIAKRVTDLPGASALFAGGVNAYEDQIKRALLAVPSAVLDACGAVSSAVAAAMARGCQQACSVPAAISCTGIAGPTGGSADKPVGLVFVGVALRRELRVTRHLFGGDRWFIREAAASAGLDELRRLLAGLPPRGRLLMDESGDA